MPTRLASLTSEQFNVLVLLDFERNKKCTGLKKLYFFFLYVSIYSGIEGVFEYRHFLTDDWSS